MRFLDLYEGKNDNKNNVDVKYTYENALKDIDSNNLYNLVCNIHRTKHNSGVSTKGFYIGGDFIEYKSEKFAELSKKLRNKYGDKLESKLLELAKKRYQEKVPDEKTAESDKMLIDTSLAKYLQNPKLATTNGNSRNPYNLVDPERYEKIGQALVYRTSEFVSKLADTTTKIDENKFKQLMIDAFNKSEEENFLYGIVDIEAKMRIDAAKQTVSQTASNNDANNKFGTESKEKKEDNNENEEDNEMQADSYYSNLSKELKMANLLFESEKVPRRVEQFSSNARVALKQADAVEATWPRQFKTWYDKYKAAFDNGVKEAQDKVREGGAGDKKYVPDPLTNQKINIRKGWGTGGPQAFLDDLYAKHPSVKSAADAINSGNLTIFNMGPRLILGLCKGLSKGGKLLQEIKDGFAEGFKEIKSAFKSGGSTKDYETHVEEAMSEGNYGEAAATQSVIIAVDCSQLLSLMENGPIGTVDFDNSTFSTANSNDQSSLEVAVQNLIGQLSKYSEVYEKYEQNKDVKVNKEASDTVVASDKEEEKKNSENNEEEDTEEDSNISDNTKPVYRPFTQFLTEADDDESQADSESKSDDESKSDSESDDDDSQTQEGQFNASLSQMSAVKEIFDDYLDIPRLKEVHDVLKSFIDSDELKNENNGLDTLKTIINLYDIMIKEDLNFDLKSDSIKNFVDGLRAINEVKEIPKIENQPIKISEDIKKFPAMEHKGTAKKKVSSEENAAKLAETIKTDFVKHVMSQISDLNNFAKSCKSDKWVNEYQKRQKELSRLSSVLTELLENVYGKGEIGDWYYAALNESENLNYLSKLYKLMVVASIIVAQLEDQAQGDREDESVKVMIHPKKQIIGTVYRSLYEKETTPEQQFEKVKHNITTFEKKLNEVDLNKILPADPNDEIYKVTDPKAFNEKINSFATRANEGLTIHLGTEGNGIISMARNIVGNSLEIGKKIRKKLYESDCKKICTMFNEGTDKNREHSDLFAYYAAAWAILEPAKKALTEGEQTEDTKLRQGHYEGNENDDSSENQENKEGQEKKESYQFPGVSPDSLINEIYKYIRGSK